MAAQFTGTKGFAARGPSKWMARAASSLPVPLRPVMSTGAFTCAASRSACRTACMRADVPRSASADQRPRTARRRPSTSRPSATSRAALRRTTAISSTLNGLQT